MTLTLNISPPLINSSNPWATTLEDLRALYHCEYTGAVTIRTSTLAGFAHDDAVHQYTFFEPNTFDCLHRRIGECQKASASLNTLGYSPISLSQTLDNVKTISDEAIQEGKRKDKPFIVSVTGTPEELRQCYDLMSKTREEVTMDLYMEVNLSCPNISGKPPPSYNYDALLEYLKAFQSFYPSSSHGRRIPIGIKTPPYTNPENFVIVKKALLASLSPLDPDGKVAVSFITATNTLGSCLLLDNVLAPVLSSADDSGIGGLAGAPLHPLALGNVKLLRRMLNSEGALRGVVVIGIGGVSDAGGFRRMKSVGAEIVGVGTALGRKGVDVFEEIMKGLEG